MTDGSADVVATRSVAFQLILFFGDFRPVQTNFERLTQDILAGQSTDLEPLEAELDGSFELTLALVDGMEPVHNVPNAPVHVVDVVLFSTDRRSGWVSSLMHCAMKKGTIVS